VAYNEVMLTRKATLRFARSPVGDAATRWSHGLGY
jgi:hypothetical protein